LIRITVVERKDGGFEPIVKTGHLLLLRITIRDGPASDAFYPAFDPPAVENAQTGNAVERSLHTAGAGSLEGAARRVQPKIDTRRKHRSEFPFVVFQVDDLERIGLKPGCYFKNLLDQLFARFIMGVSLAAKEDLQAAKFFCGVNQAFGIT